MGAVKKAWPPVMTLFKAVCKGGSDPSASGRAGLVSAPGPAAYLGCSCLRNGVLWADYGDASGWVFQNQRTVFTGLGGGCAVVRSSWPSATGRLRCLPCPGHPLPIILLTPKGERRHLYACLSPYLFEVLTPGWAALCWYSDFAGAWFYPLDRCCLPTPSALVTARAYLACLKSR